MDDDQRNRKSVWVLRGLILIVFLVGPAGLLIFALYSTDLSYPYCLIRERSWIAAKTETELDRKMVAFYTKRSISPSESMWGKNYVLNPGERMVQYLIFSKEPFDVVLDQNSNVVRRFTSYE